MAEQTNDRRILMKRFANTGSNVWKIHEEYDVSARTAEVFIAKGHAVDAYDALVEKLADCGGGLIVGEDTRDGLVEAAERAGIPMAKAAEKPEGA